ncbi:MAG: hypothetical protein NZ932_07670, partial [Candidatus Bathyarchaeota archaeon]|nr:hypothetical protein [Candidatus Bathyarchaeota archaeon]
MNRGFFNKAFVSYLLISVLITISMLDPLNFSRKTSVNTRKIYNHIENELATGGHILVDLHYGLLARTALEPQLTIIVKHLFDKNCKIVFLSTSNEGPAIFKKFQLQAPDVFAGRQYGVDYVFLGSISSGEAGVASLAKSIRETVSKDYYNTPTTDYIKLPIMKNLNGAESFALAFILSIEV